MDAEVEEILDGSEKTLLVLALDEGEVVRDVVRGPRKCDEGHVSGARIPKLNCTPCGGTAESSMVN